jgi:hypothetical protein
VSFTDQKPRVFTEEDSRANWGSHGGNLFCTLCNQDFRVGDTWRWVASSPNFQVCKTCDGPDVRDRFDAAHRLVFESMMHRGEDYWPIDIAVQLIAARKQIELLIEEKAGTNG